MTVALDSGVRATPIELGRVSPGVCYGLASVALLGLWVGFYVWSPFGFDEPGRDSWHHAAVLRELMAHPFDPANPHLPTNEASRYFTPFALLAALFGRLFSLSPYALFGVIGAAACVGLAAGCWVFARRYYASPWGPLILLLTLMFAWGAQVSHAGFHNYATLLSSAAYPSTIALVLGLFSWALALRALDDARPRPNCLVMLGVLTAVTLLTHQLSGVYVLVGTGSLILFHDRASLGIKAGLLMAMFLGSLSILAWPYFSIVDVVSSASDPRWKSAAGGMNSLSTMMILAAPAFLGMLGFRKSNGALRWELVFPAALLGAAFIVLTLQGSAIAHRLPPAIMLYNQLGLVWLILAYLRNPGHAPQLKAALATAALVVIAAAAVSAGAVRLKDLPARASQGSMIAMAEEIADVIPSGAISFATESVIFPLQSTGRRVVSIPRPEPAAPSLALRQLATDRLFSIETGAAERLRLIDRWNASYIVFVPSDLRPEVVAELKTMGPSRTFSHDVYVVTIDRTGAAARITRGTNDDR